MKFFLPLSLVLLLAACGAPPKPGTDSHQQMLAKQARENFYAMQAEHRRAHPELQAARAEAEARAKQKRVASESERPSGWGGLFAPRETEPELITESSRRTPKPSARQPARYAAVAKATPRPRNPSDDANPFARNEKSRRFNDDTIYYYDMPRGSEPSSERYRAYKAKYARSLAKRPEDLTPEEREWVRRHYRD